MSPPCDIHAFDSGLRAELSDMNDKRYSPQKQGFIMENSKNPSKIFGIFPLTLRITFKPRRRLDFRPVGRYSRCCGPIGP
jgi:hypothetical protein